MKQRVRLIVPEVVQTSNMDCGPAALKSLLDGFGIPVNYGRLREACQTDVDGTSIDTIEEVANQLGLQAEQIMLPPDHVLLSPPRRGRTSLQKKNRFAPRSVLREFLSSAKGEALALPAIAVVMLPSGATHFVVVWRQFGRFVELMDPACGRRWVSAARFLSDLYVHRQPVAAGDWRAYAGSGDFLAPLRRRLHLLGIDDETHMLSAAINDPGWRSLAALDAGVRMLESLASSKAINRGVQSARLLETLLEYDGNIPEHYWTVQPAAAGGGLVMRGAVLVRALGPNESHAPTSPELLATLHQPSPRPGRELARLLRADGVFTPAVIGMALALAAAAVIVEAILFRSLLGAGRELLTAVVAFSVALLFLEIPIATSLLRFGRRLEIRLRIAFLEKLPHLGDRYFQSRLKSDMAERSHSLHLLRRLPELGGQLLRYGFEIAFTAAGIVWLDPASAPIVILAAFAAVAIPLASQPLLMERDLRLRTHAGALAHFYLDALLGLVAIHTHGGQAAVRREHESLLTDWARAGLNLQRSVISLETLQFLAGFGLAIWLLASYLARHGQTGAVLLLVYWALNLPALGQEVAIIAWQYPAYRNVTLRLLEPLGAIEAAPAIDPKATLDQAVSIAFENVSVVAAGHQILRDINLSIPAGSHVAIVGASGAGKSSLAGLLLGWHRAASGVVVVNGMALDDSGLNQLRSHIAWVDPAVQLWNRPLLDNLQYGLATSPRMPIESAIDAAELRRVIERLPNGLETPLGEGGGLVSGGEGQRVRLGRALLRSGVRLAILDEPFRGLDSEQRHALLSRARELWRDATLIFISHDIREALAFERVLVMEDGTIAEDGRGPRFHAMLDAETAIRDEFWDGAEWRHLHLANGNLTP
jgi:ABC-type bacteriocin/lantibiotic exporter with double-glycine peptidase domain